MIRSIGAMRRLLEGLGGAEVFGGRRGRRNAAHQVAVKEQQQQ